MAACQHIHTWTRTHTRTVHGPVPAVLSHTLEEGLISAVVMWAEREDRSADTRASYTARLLALSNSRCPVYMQVWVYRGGGVCVCVRALWTCRSQLIIHAVRFPSMCVIDYPGSEWAWIRQKRCVAYEEIIPSFFSFSPLSRRAIQCISVGDDVCDAPTGDCNGCLHVWVHQSSWL